MNTSVWLKKMAAGISTLFNPMASCTWILIAVSVKTAHDPMIAMCWIFLVGVPLGILLVGITRGIWSDLDVSHLRERRTYMPWTLLSSSLGTSVAWLASMPILIRFLMASIWLWLLISTIVGMFWKISLHAGANAGAVLMVAIAFGTRSAEVWVWVPLLVAAARVYSKHHTILQVLAGALAGLASVWVVASTLGLIPVT